MSNEKVKKLQLGKLPKMNQPEMDCLVGGYGSGTQNDPYVLPEVVVTPPPICPDNFFGCCQCPPFGSGPASAGDPAVNFGYAAGVAINHYLYH